MSRLERTPYAPRTRGGSLISCVAFAATAASVSLPRITDALTPVMGFGYVLAVLTTVSAARAVRPGTGWFRAALPLGVSTAAYLGSAVIALATVVVSWSVETPASGWVAAAVIVAGGCVIAAAPPSRAGSR
ncbi:hypothetical protein EDF64_11340 [Curtobacterium flaccumfaciens]|uniref:Uncharacterized protein n=1 Tax=Curtobacterium flaccumfaciens TaxID=2035 RepID=A0A4R6DD34_9MICO|nr:hypothetical protein [Curtobacterium flaccumfaciens]TDN42263.1 hypothetical protein EDF64_11340 [Curtobacterium flaccumfaciens]